MGDEYLSATADGGCQDMPVFGIVGHFVDEHLVADDQRVRESPVHLIQAMSNLLLVQSASGEIPLKFGHHRWRPQRTVDTCLRNAEQCVA